METNKPDEQFLMIRRLVRIGMPLLSKDRVSLRLALLACALLAWTSLAASQEGLPVVVTEAVEQPILRQLQVQGTVTSARSAQLSAATSGQVELVMVDAGSRVMAGDVLLTLDAELVQLQVEGARARVEQAQQALSDANRRLLEVRKLAPQQSIAESLVLDIQAEVAEDEASLREVQAQAALDEAILARHTVRAPFAGVVAAKLTESGEWVTPGQAIFTLISTTQLRLDFQVAEDFLSLVGPETKVEYSVGPGSDARYVGRFVTAVPVADRGDRTFLLRVAPQATHTGLIPGRSVTAILKIPTGRAGVVVPRDALLRYPDGRAVIWVIEPQGDALAAREVLVQTGLQFDGLVEVRDGLGSGDRVVVQGNETLRPGQKVTVRASAGSVKP